MRSIRKKLRSRRGITLVEMIAATGVLALLGLMLHTGLFMAQNSYGKMMAESESQILLSTLTDLLCNELRYARDVVTTNDGTLSRYTSANFGSNTTLSVDKNGELMAKNRRVLSSGAYGNGAYCVDTWNITYDEDGRVFQVYLMVTGPHSTSNETSFSVRCLNGDNYEGGNA